MDRSQASRQPDDFGLKLDSAVSNHIHSANILCSDERRFTRVLRSSDEFPAI